MTRYLPLIKFVFGAMLIYAVMSSVLAVEPFLSVKALYTSFPGLETFIGDKSVIIDAILKSILIGAGSFFCITSIVEYVIHKFVKPGTKKIIETTSEVIESSTEKINTRLLDALKNFSDNIHQEVGKSLSELGALAGDLVDKMIEKIKEDGVNVVGPISHDTMSPSKISSADLSAYNGTHQPNIKNEILFSGVKEQISQQKYRAAFNNAIEIINSHQQETIRKLGFRYIYDILKASMDTYSESNQREFCFDFANYLRSHLDELNEPIFPRVLAYYYWKIGDVDASIDIMEEALDKESMSRDLSLLNSLSYYFADAKRDGKKDFCLRTIQKAIRQQELIKLGLEQQIRNETKDIEHDSELRERLEIERARYHQYRDTEGFILISYAEDIEEVQQGEILCKSASEYINDRTLLSKHLELAKKKKAVFEETA